MTTITLANPWSKATVRKDAADLVSNFDSYLQLIDPDTIEAVNAKVDTDDKATWLSAWAEHVGPEQAGIIILGS